MSFKDIVAQDVKKVFMNTEEFADYHNVDGVQMKVIVDDNEIIERQKKEKSKMDGVFVKQKLIYVTKEEFGQAPAVNRIITFDGKAYKVLDVTDETGMYAILMESNRTR